MKTIFVDGKEVVVKGRARSLKQDSLARAERNSVFPLFNSKFTFPRANRIGENQKP